MLLAIDSSAGTSVAVVDRDAGVLSQLAVADTMRHAEVIGELILAALETAQVAPSRLSAVAIGVGPGPFTGLRVGMAAGRVFGLGCGKPVVNVNSHDAVAFDRYGAGHSGDLLVVTDARRRELYWSRYEGVDELGLPVRSAGPEVSAPNQVPVAAARLEATEVPAGSLGMLAETLFAAGRSFAEPRALYLRSPDVTLSKPKRVTG